MSKRAWSILLLSMLPTLSGLGGVRHFTYLYEAPTAAPGSVELENTITWAHGADWNDVAFREELEVGVTDRFQVGIYPLDWGHHAEDSDKSQFAYDGGALELIYNLSNPVIDPVGISVYEEIRAARQHFELESKLIAQKDLGRWILDYNATLEAEWESKGLQQQSGELQQAAGASYEISQRLSIGIELLHEFVFPDWRDEEKIRNVFVGPNVSYRHGEWFVTVTALAQATDTADEPDFQVRTIFGVGF
jgi:hypothetical protein